MDKRTFIGLAAVVLALVLAWLFWPDQSPQGVSEISAPAAPVLDPAPDPVADPVPSPDAATAAQRPEELPVRGGVLEGHVQDEQGRPVRAKVHLKVIDVDVRADVAEGAAYLVQNRSMESDGDGKFRFPVSPGSYELFARSKNLGATDGWTPVEVPAGTRREVVLTLKTGQVLRGRTVSREGSPVAGARIVVRDAVRLNPSFSKHPEWREPNAFSDSEGRFQVAGVLLPEMGLRVHASHPEQSDAVTDLTAVPSTEVLLVMGPRIKGGGARLMGKVVDETGQPIARARVRVRSLSWTEPRPKRLPGESWYEMTERTGTPALGYEVYTGEDGKFEIDKIPAGGKRVIFEADGKRPSSMLGLEVKDGDAYGGIDAILEGGLSIDGRIVDDAGQSLAGADVVCVGEDYRSQLRETLPDGTFRCTGLPEGPANLEASLVGHAVNRALGVPAGKSGLIIALARTGSLTGTVRKSGAAAKSFRLTVERIGGASPSDMAASVEERAFDETAAGQFSYAAIDPGTYRLTARVGDASSPPATITVQPGRAAAVALDVP